jgi:tetratricopeptide (TPR) repeat protein
MAARAKAKDRSARWGWLLLPLAVLILYAPTLPYGFVWDDVPLIVENRMLSPENASLLWRSPFWRLAPGAPPEYDAGYFRPLTAWSYFLERSAFGARSALPYHATNLLLYLTTVLLAWRLLRRWLREERWSLAGALFFATHPMHVESVTFISGRTDLLAGAFILGAALLHSRPRAALEWRSVAGIAVCGLAAMLSKETGLLLVPLLLAIDRWHHRLTLRQIAAERWPLYAALAVPTIGYLIWRHAALGSWLASPVPGAPTIDRRFLVPHTLSRYLALTFLPFSHSAFYNLKDWSPGFTLAFATSLLILVACAVAVFALRRDRCLPLGVALWGLFLLPVSNLLSIPAAYLAERFLFLPALGGSLVLTALLRRAGGHRAWWGWSAAGVLILSWAVGTVLRNPVWRDNETLFTQIVRESPHTAMAHNNLGLELARRERHREALGHFLSALQLDSAFVTPYGGAGLAWLNLGRADSAAAILERGLRFGPQDRAVRTNLGWAYVDLGRAGEAARILEPVCAEDPMEVHARLNLAEAYLALGKVAEASSVAAELLRLDPRNVRVQVVVGKVRLREGRPELGFGAFQEARALDPSSPLPLVALVSAYCNPPRPDSMIRYAEELVRLDGNSSDGWNGLGAGRLLKGEYSVAIEALERARSLAPGDFPAFTNLLIAYQRSGQVEVARRLQADWIARFPNHPKTAELARYRF